MWQPSNEANIHAGSDGWLSQAALESANGLWHHQQQPSYQLESIYQPETIYQYQTEQSWQLTDFESMQLPQSEQQFVESTEQPNDQRPAYPPSFQFHYPYQVASQRQNSQKPACQQQSFQQSNYLQQSYQQEANQQQSCQQTICPLACQQNCQSTRQSDFNALYNQRWKCDLYSLTEQPLAEVSISDADCPVCQWDRQFTRIREAPEPPDWPYTNWTTSQQRLPRIDGASKILMSFNSQLAAIYIDASVGHCAGGGGTGAGRHGGSGRGAGGGSGSGAGGGTSADGGAGGGASAGGGGGLSVSASSAMIAPRQLVNASRMKLAPSYARFESPNLTAPAAAQQPGSSASLHRRLAPTPPQQQQQQPPPPPPPAAHSKEAATPVPQSSEPESVAASRLIVPSAPKARRSSPRSSRVSDAVAKAAAKAAAAAPEPLQRDVAFERTSERSSMLKSLSSGGTPRPWTSGSGTVAVKAGAEGGAAPATSTATSEVTTTLGGAQIGEGESSEGNSGDDRPGKTTIQLLRFKTSDQAVPGNAPRRIEPPHFVSQHRPENVVSSGAAGDGFLRPQLGRPRSPQLQLHRANFSNSEVADQSNLAPSEAADRQKQIMANAMRLARLIEASWGLL